jgi:hypothetical protein
MTTFTRFNFSVARSLAIVATAISTSTAWAQASCSSDGQRAPTALIERFISADCDNCWSDAKTAKPKPGELALDWIVPSARGDDAPLSAAASRDALYRLEALKESLPKGTFKDTFDFRRRPLPSPLPLRVARGVALGGYVGVSISLTPPRGTTLPIHPMTAHLLLVEEIPAGTDGTPVARNLVRNALEITWNEPGLSPPQPNARKRLYESRPMSIPQGANPDRLRVVGWVEDVNGKLIASAASVCEK